MSISVALDQTVALPTSLSNNQAVIRSPTLNLSVPGVQDVTAIELLNNVGDCLLVVSFRRHADTVVLNSKYASGNWGPEQTYSNLNRAFGPNLTEATIIVKDVGSGYQIFINGNFLTTYAKRAGGDAVSIYYLVTAGPGSVLSNPITVEME